MHLRLVPLLLVLASAVSADLQAQRPVQAGFYAGVNQYRVTLSPREIEDLFSQKQGFQVLGFVEIPAGSLLGVQWEAGTASRGYRFDLDRTTVSTRLNFVEVANLLKAYPVTAHSETFGQVSPYAFLGPRANLFVDYRSGGGGTNGPVYRDTTPEEFATFSLSGVVGIGVLLRQQTGLGVRLEGRYSVGLTDLYDELEMRARGLDLLIGVVF